MIPTLIAPLIATLIKDIRYAARMLFQTSRFTVVAVLALALGIGANTATFNVVNDIVLRCLPFRDSSSLVMVWQKSPLNDRNVISPASYPDSKSRNHVFGDLAAVVDIFHLNLSGSGEPEELPAAASPSAWEVLPARCSPALARLPGCGHRHAEPTIPAPRHRATRPGM